MAYEFKLPDVGEGITTGDIKKWHVKKGQRIEEDETLVDIETDKAVVELPSPVGGIVEDVRFDEGSTANVGDVLAVIKEEAEKAGQTRAEQPAPEEPAKTEQRKEPPKPVAQEPKVPILATPATRMLARELNVSLETVKGTGPGGRLMDEDVRKAAKKPEKPEKPEKKEPAPQPSVTAAGEKRVPLRGIRRTISDNLLKSMLSTAQVSLMDDADVTALIEMRERINEGLPDDTKVSYLAFTVKAVITALREYPYLNASVDDEKKEIVIKRFYNIGIAVDTPRGLIVPVVKDADRKSLVEISKEIKNLVLMGNDGKIGLEQLKGGTFTIANIGSIGGLFSTPILNYSESAILEMQQIRDMPRVVDGEVVARKVMNLSLTIDHRIIDGAKGQLFLNEVKKYLEKPELLFAGMV